MYFSRRTTPEEAKYQSYDLETLVIAKAVKYIRIYFLGIRFKIETGCNTIKASATKEGLVPRIARWGPYCRMFNLKLNIEKGNMLPI